MRRCLIVALGLTACALSAGCVTYHKETRPLPELLASRSIDRVRLSMEDQDGGLRIVEVAAPKVQGDSLLGFAVDSGIGRTPELDRFSATSRFSAPLASIREVEIRRISPGSLIALGVVVGVTAIAVAAIRTGDDGRSESTGYTMCCPVVSTWNGSAWRTDSGTFGGAIAEGLRRTDLDLLEHAPSEESVLRIRMEDLAFEVEHVDEVTVLVAEHAPDVSVAPDGQGGIRTLGQLISPSAALAIEDGSDVLGRVERLDGRCWESRLAERDTADARALRDGVDLTFLKAAATDQAKLVVDGQNTAWSAYLMGRFVAAHGSMTEAWYAALKADPAAARDAAARFFADAYLEVRVLTCDGWATQGRFHEAGPEVRKRQVMDLDLTRVPGDSVRIRLEAIPNFWLIDRVALDQSEDRPVRWREVAAGEARDSRSGTDVRGILQSPDRAELRMNPGDAVEMVFDIGPVAPGVSRSVLLRTSGWYQILTDTDSSGDPAALRRIGRDPHGLSVLTVAMLNGALASLRP